MLIYFQIFFVAAYLPVSQDEDEAIFAKFYEETQGIILLDSSRGKFKIWNNQIENKLYFMWIKWSRTSRTVKCKEFNLNFKL